MHWEDICTNCRKDLCEELIVRGGFAEVSSLGERTLKNLSSDVSSRIGMNINVILLVSKRLVWFPNSFDAYQP